VNLLKNVNLQTEKEMREQHRDWSTGDVIILWHVDPLLGNDRETSEYATAVARNGSADNNFTAT
jgi:hypothetical protein